MSTYREIDCYFRYVEREEYRFRLTPDELSLTSDERIGDSGVCAKSLSRLNRPDAALWAVPNFGTG